MIQELKDQEAEDSRLANLLEQTGSFPNETHRSNGLDLQAAARRIRELHKPVGQVSKGLVLCEPIGDSELDGIEFSFFVTSNGLPIIRRPDGKQWQPTWADLMCLALKAGLAED